MKKYVILTLITIVAWFAALAETEISKTAAVLFTIYLVLDYFRVNAYVNYRETRAVEKVQNETDALEGRVLTLEATVNMEGQEPKTFKAGF